ncbi:MAG: carbohydrate binding domain-containing protein [Bacteroidaceae bacterium]|nr:carbohydrate binding domain-containing protein [Bacteroidaceae bacterium]
MKKTFLTLTLIAACLCTQAQVTFNLNAARRGAVIGPLHYGIFFEEINHAGEGGLYAEMVRNRSFEENAAAPDFWSTTGTAKMELDQSLPLNANNPTALKVTVDGSRCGIANEGFWGMAFKRSQTYTVSFWVRCSRPDFGGIIRVELQDAGGTSVGGTAVSGVTDQWQKFTVKIKATKNATGGRLVLLPYREEGTFYFDMVSLFPPTFKERENGCRTDLAQMLADLNPAFMRFPGGCYIEGNWTAEHPQSNHFRWKETIGPVEERPGHFNNNWGYPVSDGLGMMEFLLLCEDLGCEPLYVVNMGMGHGWEDPNVEWYIQDALDAIEFCNGDAETTTWGRRRAELGHPAPFNLRLLEIGNENYWFGPYGYRYGVFRERIAAQHPEIIFIGDGDGITWGLPHPVDAIDQHYYMTPAWFTGEYHRYDGYQRGTYTIYVGEYAVTGVCGHYGNMNAALGEAVFMCGMENNSDVVTMTSYAPIFCNENNYQWAPDIIRFNSSQSYGTPSYYVQQMMATNLGRQNIRWTEANNTYDAANKVGLSTYGTTATYDNLLVTTLEGDTLYFNDFSSSDLSDFQNGGGTWRVNNGKLAQTDANLGGGIFALNRTFGSDYIVECDAVKTGGNEGFLLCFNITGTNDYVWWNVGGWGNTKQGVEQCMSGTRGNDGGDSKNMDAVVKGQQYHLKVRVQGNQARCFLNNAEVNSKTLTTKSQKIYLAASIDDDTQTLYVKAVNPYETPQKTVFNLQGATFESGTVVTLSSGSGADENTTSNPNLITPQTRKLNATQLEEQVLTYTIPAHGFCIFRLAVGPQAVERETLPEPLVLYSFETGRQTDDSGTWPFTLQGDGTVSELFDGSHAFFSASTGYLNMGSDMAHDVLSRLSGDYSVSIDLMPTSMQPLWHFSWAYGLSDGTNRYIGLVNSPSNRNWYYEVRNEPANTAVYSDGGLMTDRWHNITYTQQNGLGSIYIDGVLLGTKQADGTQPSDFAARLTSACLARSPFGGDALMSQTWFDDFQIYGSALSEGQVATLYARTLRRATTDSVPTSISAPTSDETLSGHSNSTCDGVFTLQGQRLADTPDQLRGYRGIVVWQGRKLLMR